MSHQKKIEQVLELLINEEHEAASELLHSVIVEKARNLYEDLVDEDEFGGDAKEDFADEIEADDDEIEGDEDGDEVEDDGEYDADDADEDEEVEDRVEDLEAEFAELKAEFDALVAGEAGDAGEEEFDDMAMGDADAEMDYNGAEDELEVEGMYEEDYDDLDEATKLQDEQKADLKKEGELTGKGGSAGSTGSEAPFTKAPKKKDHGGKPHQTGLGGDESGYKASRGKDNTPEDNIDVPHKKAGEKVRKEDGDDQSAESVLGSKGNPKGA